MRPAGADDTSHVACHVHVLSVRELAQIHRTASVDLRQQLAFVQQVWSWVHQYCL